MGVAGALFDSVKLLDVSKNYISRLTTEKLYEEVLSTTENTLPSFHEKIRIAEVREYDYNEVNKANKKH